MIDVLNRVSTDKKIVESNGHPQHRYMLRERKPKPTVVVIPLGKPVPRRKRTAKKIQVKAELSLTKRSGRSVLKQKTWQSQVKVSSARGTRDAMTQRKNVRAVPVPRKSVHIKSEKMSSRKFKKSSKMQTKEKLKSFRAMKSVRKLSPRRLMAKSAKVSSSTAKAAIESSSSRHGQSSRGDRRPARASKSEMLLAEPGDTSSVFDGRTGGVFKALTNDLPKPSYVEVIDMEP